MPTLYIMRHGKAENTAPDINRQLSNIGKENVASLAQILKGRSVIFGRVIYSPAARAKETAMLMCEGLNVAIEKQFEDKRIYNASLSELKIVISEIDEKLESVLIVGHNPGLADLVLKLCEEGVHLSAGNIAVVHGDSWEDIRNCKCKFVEKY